MLDIVLVALVAICRPGFFETDHDQILFGGFVLIWGQTLDGLLTLPRSEEYCEMWPLATQPFSVESQSNYYSGVLYPLIFRPVLPLMLTVFPRSASTA